MLGSLRLVWARIHPRSGTVSGVDRTYVIMRRMMHMVIDTSVYRTDPKRSRAGFHAITRLAVAQRIRNHLPYYVRQEVLTQQAERLSKEFNKAIKSLESVKRISARKSTADVINRTLGQIKKLANDAAATACEELDSWIENTQTLKYEFDEPWQARHGCILCRRRTIQ